jgi:CobW/HypB/UreG, nucleotide-binding domain
MRTPVMLVAGQGDTEAVVRALLRRPGTLVVEHRFDGHVVRRTVITLRHGVLTSAETILELAHGCVTCTIRNDLLVLLRQLHRRDDVDRIVVHLAPWLEPEPICWSINHVRVRVGPGYIDGPAARDVEIAAVLTCIDSRRWLAQALGDDELDDGRTVAQVVVGQAEFADVLVLTDPEPATLAVLRRLAPRSRITAIVWRWDWRTWNRTPGAGAAAPRTTRYWPANRHWMRRAPSISSSSGRGARFIRNGCTPPLTCCWTEWSGPGDGSGWPPTPSRRCGSNLPEAGCESNPQESGSSR